MVGAHSRGNLVTSWWAGAKREKKKGARVPISPLKGTFPMTKLSPTRFHLVKVPPTATLGTVPLAYKSLGDIPDPNYSILFGSAF
jgi:hypothetical protein